MLQEVAAHATLGALFRYWDKKRGARQMPARRDIDPLEMDRRLLPHLMLCEVAEEGERIRFRLVGTALVKRLGTDPTGRFLADLPPGKHFDFLAKLLRRVHAQAAPVYGESVFRWGLKGKLEARQLLLPLSTSGAATIVLVGVAYSSSDVFPPPILELNLVAEHGIVKWQSVTPTAPAPRRKVKSAGIA